MDLSLISIEKDGLVRLAARGQIVAKDIQNDAANPLAKVVGRQWATNKVLLSLEEADYLDSSAIGWLLTCQKEFNRNGGQMVLYAIPGHVRQILDMLRIGTILPMADNEEEARQILLSKETQS